MANKRVKKPASKAREKTGLDAVGNIGITEGAGGAQPQGEKAGKIKSQEIVDEICHRLANGETLTHICRSIGMPEPRTVRDWQLTDETIAAVIARARDIGFDAIAEQCLTIADDDEEDPQSRRVKVETRLKLLAKWCHRRYGDKVELEHSGNIDSKVTVVSEEQREKIMKLRRAALTGGSN